ncbi:Squalene hopene cyclase [Cupriavidus taiwanensis]|uniref:squalene--hopene cyclase n=1 Tax=Cupriavidus taiwanensis TaxID=164546 RepID=UPI000E13AA0D|nr:squalene--hopene cyclase [Cupriavidus taiwanensis]SPA32773.1 Squalene hopene cyclase [Cupriavidus taiwanensis]
MSMNETALANAAPHTDAAQREPAGPAQAPATRLSAPALDHGIGRALDALLHQQRPDGHWIYELEADATIPAEYVLMVHYLGEAPDLDLEARMARYLRRIQNPDGGWPLFHQGRSDVSASVKAYFALKMAGDDPQSAPMQRARQAIHAMGGAEATNVFTRTLLALYGVLPWKAVPMMPVEIMLLPRWFPFHLSKISYWARTVIVPLLVLNSLRPQARNPRGIGINELFVGNCHTVGLPPRAPHQHAGWYTVFRGLDALLRVAEPLLPRTLRRRAIAAAQRFVRERLNGEDGLGAIFPAMANSVMMFDVLGVPPDDPARAVARRSLERLLVEHGDEAYCQPCLSPVWDTALATHALMETGEVRAAQAAGRALDWLRPLQVLDLRGDWAVRRPLVRPGGWAFQYANAYYPDVDDTAVVAAAMDRFMRAHDAPGRYGEAVARATEWIVGMQSGNGGWGAFEPENTHLYLNNIPFADHGALLDPPTADVSARCLSMLCQTGATPGKSEPAARALRYLLAEQMPDGSWFGRWGTNYIYGTWSALCALNAAGLPPAAPELQRAVAWLARIQNADGGWGEDGSSYRLDYRGYEPAPSVASQTAWALLAMMAAGAAQHAAVARGIDYLLRTQQPGGLWHEPRFTAVGFPRVFYLRYHGYARYFPLWALARYRNLQRGHADHRGHGGQVSWGL